MRTVLVVDDEEHIRAFLAEALAEHRVVGAGDGREALAVLRRESPDAVLLDVRLPGRDGIAVLEAVRREAPDVPVIMVTAVGEPETVVAALKAGATDYLTKPIDLQRLRVSLGNALERARLSSEVRALRSDVAGRGRPFIGRSAAARRVVETAERVAETDATVLVTGESGTGKEVIARLIHERSRRSGGPFVAVNTTAIPATLVEAELFGHERGAFTGATTRRPGRFELASGGTILLDEVGALPGEIQPKLLRVLQERIVERLGGTSQVKVDVRVIAATAADLEADVAAGRFREDLYYRLHVVPIRIPPLRERAEDVPLLVETIRGRLTERLGKPLGPVEPAALEALCRHPWPGNVRELENVLERVAVVAPAGAPLRADDLPESVRAGGRPVEIEGVPVRVGMTLEAIEAEAIRRTLEAEGGNLTRAAAVLGVTRKTLREKARKYGLRS